MGIAVNVISGLIMHRVSNKLLLLIGALSYTVSFLLLALIETGTSDWYWSRVFPSMLLTVVGADLEFTVVNMYVVGCLPRRQQSMAGGIMQVMTKLSVVVGLGVGTALFTRQTGSGTGTGEGGVGFKGYQATFWLSMACSGISVFMVPFLRLRTQGHKKKGSDVEERERDGGGEEGVDEKKALEARERQTEEERERKYEVGASSV